MGGLHVSCKRCVCTVINIFIPNKWFYCFKYWLPSIHTLLANSFYSLSLLFSQYLLPNASMETRDCGMYSSPNLFLRSLLFLLRIFRIVGRPHFLFEFIASFFQTFRPTFGRRSNWIKIKESNEWRANFFVPTAHHLIIRSYGRAKKNWSTSASEMRTTTAYDKLSNHLI